MSQILLISLYVLGGLSVLFLTFIAVKVGRNFYKVKNAKPVNEELAHNVEETIKAETENANPLGEENEPIKSVEETPDEVKADDLAIPSEPVTDISADQTEEVAITECAPIEDTPVEDAPIEDAPVEESVISIGDIEDETDEMADKLNIKRVHFAQKLLKLDESVMLYYDEIYNKFNSKRGVCPRISFKHVTFRHKRKLIAKLTIKGKTLKLHLALDTEAFNKNVYFQTSLENLKAYEEVPFTVKVKSARGLKNALTLIEILCEKEGVEPKSRYKKVNSIDKINEIIGIK